MDTKTAGTRDQTQASWARRPIAAAFVRTVLFAAPIFVGWLAVHLSSPSFFQLDGRVGFVVWIAQAIVVATAATKLGTLAVRRLAPLPVLLGMTLIFPDQTPSRFGVALRSGTVKKMLDGDDVKLSPDTQAAAEEAVALVGLLRTHESLTRGHTERVRSYADLIGEEMGLDEADRDRLRWGVLLHDVGKLRVPAELLSKTGRPTEDEWAIIRTHPAEGGKILAPLMGWLGDWGLAASQHHERWDGGGYPLGLSGHEISLAGRITAVADAYDVITSRRSYKDPMSADVAREEIVACAGTQFDPEVVRAFLRCGVRATSLPGAFSWLLELPGVARVTSTASSIPLAGASAAVVAIAGVTGLGATGDVPESLAFDVTSSADDDLEGASADAELSITTSTFPTSTTSEPTTTEPATTSSETSTPSTEAVPTSITPTTTRVAPTTRPQTTAAPSTAAPTTAVPTTAASGCQQARNGESNLAGADLGGCDLAGVSISEVDLSNANLSGANLHGARVSNFNLAGANLAGADLGNAVFTDGSFVGANLSGTDARNISITRTDIAYVAGDQANFEGATLTQVSFGFSQMTNADFRNSTLSGVNFNDGNISGSQFGSAQMPSTEFWRTIGTGTSFVSAAMRYSPMGDADFTDARFDSADARDTMVNNTDLDRAHLAGANFQAASGLPANAASAVFSSTTCPGGVVQNTSCW